MNIKIFTFYYTNNYGTLIQALSLQEFLSKNTNLKVEFAKYQPKKLLYREIFRPIIKKNLSDSLKNMIKSYRLRNWKKEKKLPKPKKNIDEYNSSISVYGSDAIWHTYNFMGFQPYFFGEGNNKFKITYATSIGPSNFDKSSTITKDKIKKLLNAYDHISVRDNNTALLVKEMTGKQPLIVVDPVFLVDFNFINYPLNKIKNYVLIYGTVFTENDKKKIINFCKLKKLKIISIGYYNKWADKNFIYANPEEFLSYIIGANYIFTSMFHGVMLSVKFNKNFWYSVDPIRTNKIEYFINNLDLSTRSIENSNNFSDKINYDLINLKLNKWIEESQNFLIECIKNKE
jgi:hypothetical protein